MKKYLNKQERDSFLMLVKLTDTLEIDIIKNWDKRQNLTSDERKWLKTAYTYMQKASQSIMDRMDQCTQQQLLRDTKYTDIFCMPTSAAQVQYEKYRKENPDTIGITQEGACLLAEQALEECSRNCTCEDHNKCALKAIYLELEIPVADDAPLDGCPYKIVK